MNTGLRLNGLSHLTLPLQSSIRTLHTNVQPLNILHTFQFY